MAQNTSATPRSRVNSQLSGYNYQRYDFVDNWIGWKLLVAPLNKPDESSRPGPDVTRINKITIGFWNSRNVNGTFSLNNVTLGIGRWIEQDSFVPSDQFLTKLLVRGSVPYSITPENSLNTLDSNNVYFFANNPCYVSSGLFSNLTYFVKNGANVIFTNPNFEVPCADSTIEYSIPNLMNYTLTLNPLHEKSITLNSNSQSINCSLMTPYRLCFGNEAGIETIASFNFSDGTSAPYILREKIGSGSIIFVDFSVISGLSMTSKNEILDFTIAILLEIIPPANDSFNFQQLSIPSQVFSDKAFSGTTFDLWSSPDLRNKLQYDSDVIIQGSFSVSSGCMKMNSDSFYIDKLLITQGNNSYFIDDESVRNISIYGSGQISFNSSIAELHNWPTGQYSILNVTDYSSSLVVITCYNATISYETQSNETISYRGNFNLTYISTGNPIFIRAEKPIFEINGSVDGRMHGGLIYDNYYIYKRAEQTSIKGNFSLVIQYSSGIIFAEMKDVCNIFN